MKNKTFVISSACFVALICATLASAAEKKASSPAPAASASPAAKTSASPAKQNTRPIPFHGMVSATDQTAKTFTITGKETSRVFKVTDNTKITKAGQPAALADITENVEVSGSYWKDTMEAKTVKIGPMVQKKATDEGKKPKTSASPSASASPVASPKTH